jgi:hypothetical protein
MRQQAFDDFFIGGTDHASSAQTAFLLLGFFGQHMTMIGVATLEPARGGFLETLGRAPVGFQLGHRIAPFRPLEGTLHLTLLKRPQGALYGSETLFLPRDILRGAYFGAKALFLQAK